MEQMVIIGAGRHPATKGLRALRGHPRRTFYIGTLHITSGKRLPITTEWAALYFDTICKHITDGNVLLQYKTDKFVTPDELKILCFGLAEEKADYEQQIAQDDGFGQDPDPEVSADGADAAEDGPVDPSTPAAVEPMLPPAPDPEPLMEHAAPVVDAEPVQEPEPEPAPAVEEAAVEAPAVTEAEPEPEAAPVEEEPATEPETAAEPVVDEAPAAAALPEHWRQAKKSVLMELAEARGIDVSSMPSNRELIKLIEATEK